MGGNSYILHAFKDILLLCLGVCCVSLWMYAAYTWMLVEAGRVCWGPCSCSCRSCEQSSETELRCPGRTAYVLNCQGCSPASRPYNWERFIILFMHVSGECMRTCLCRCPHRGLKRTSDPLELESQALVSPNPAVVTGIKTLILMSEQQTLPTSKSPLQALISQI